MRLEVAVDYLFDAILAVGEFPVSRRDIDAKELLGFDHVLARAPERGRRTLPGIAAIE